MHKKKRYVTYFFKLLQNDQNYESNKTSKFFLLVTNSILIDK